MNAISTIPYYTPKIEEFHIGFKYERWQSVLVDKGWHKIYELGWIEKEVNDACKLWQLKSELENHNQIRIRYLDETDLKELGFTFICTDGPWTMYKLELSSFTWELRTLKDTNNIIIQDHNQFESASFMGECKNISELKRILKQIEWKRK